MTLPPGFADPWVGPVIIGSFTTLPNTTTTSPVFTLPPNAHAVRVTWRNLNTGFGLNPNNVTVQSPTGDIMHGNIDIGSGILTNLKSSDVVVPVAYYVEPNVVVMVTEPGTGDTHKVYVTATFNPSYLAVNLSGSEITQPVRIATVGNSVVLSTFGELAVGGAGGQTIQTTTAVNAINTNTLPQVPGFSWHVQSIAASCLASPTSTIIVTATDGFSTWSQYLDRDTGPRVHVNHWTFPDGGLSFLVGAGVTITLSADATTTKLAVQAANRTYGP